MSVCKQKQMGKQGRLASQLAEKNQLFPWREKNPNTHTERERELPDRQALIDKASLG